MWSKTTQYIQFTAYCIEDGLLTPYHIALTIDWQYAMVLHITNV